MFKQWKLRRKEQKQKCKLYSKAQKAKSLDMMPEVLKLHGHNQRIKAIQYLRVMK